MSMNSTDYDEVKENQEIITQFRNRVRDILTSDHTDAILLRWLRAKNFNLEEAEENLRGSISTKEFFHLNNVLDWYVKPEVIEKNEATAFLGFAKDGSGIRYVMMDLDYYGFMLSSSFWDLNIYFCYLMDGDLKLLKEESFRTGRMNDQMIYILDMKTYSLHQFTHACVLETALEFFRLLQDHYPEIWKCVFFVNVPPIFDMIYSLFKPVLRENFVRKLKIASKENTKELLRTYIDDDVLPAFLGGQKVDSTGDPNFKKLIKSGRKIPEKLYFKNCLRFMDLTDPGVKSEIIHARRVFNLPIIIKEKVTKIKIEFRTENGPITFMVLFRDFNANSEQTYLPASEEHLDPHDDKCNVQVVGIRFRIQCHVAPCKMTAYASKPGIYILQFCNTSGWFTSRKLFYRVTLLPPKNSDE